MELLKDKEFNGFFFEIQKEGISEGNFVIFIRVTNLNDKKKKIAIKTRYISVEHGLINPKDISPFELKYGLFLLPISFVDARIVFYSIKKAQDGDRMEFVVNDGRIASLLLIRDKGDWYIADAKDRASINKQLKNRIEHFEYLDEKFGLTLQKFSARVIDENSLDLFTMTAVTPFLSEVPLFLVRRSELQCSTGNGIFLHTFSSVC